MVCLPPFVRHLAKYAKVWRFLPLRGYAMEHGIYSRHAVSVTRSSMRTAGRWPGGAAHHPAREMVLCR